MYSKLLCYDFFDGLRKADLHKASCFSRSIKLNDGTILELMTSVAVSSRIAWFGIGFEFTYTRVIRRASTVVGPTTVDLITVELVLHGGTTAVEIPTVAELS